MTRLQPQIEKSDKEIMQSGSVKAYIVVCASYEILGCQARYAAPVSRNA